jgi:hypothetical protein
LLRRFQAKCALLPCREPKRRSGIDVLSSREDINDALENQP